MVPELFVKIRKLPKANSLGDDKNRMVYETDILEGQEEKRRQCWIKRK